MSGAIVRSNPAAGVVTFGMPAALESGGGLDPHQAGQAATGYCVGELLLGGGMLVAVLEGAGVGAAVLAGGGVAAGGVVVVIGAEGVVASGCWSCPLSWLQAASISDEASNSPHSKGRGEIVWFFMDSLL